ncbi:ABC-transporter, putative [Babesia caballi]|uniref:ABC-transporter, putative n=1 Tax=Babesia caballi TaxID=5871 RepID=A0AAV4LWX0_BABCB|nr:ABC-transporter, putative [Babesia caballi]
MATREYLCLFARNCDKKNKTWRDGVIYVHETHRFARVSLYEVDANNGATHSAVDSFDLFNHKYDSLKGEVITSPRYIVNVFDVNPNAKHSSAAPRSAKVDKRDTPVGGGQVARTPALGTCRAFKKYRISSSTMPNSLQALPSAPNNYGRYQVNDRSALEDERTSMENARVNDPSAYTTQSPRGRDVSFLNQRVDSLEFKPDDSFASRLTESASVSYAVQKHMHQTLPLMGSPDSASGVTRKLDVATPKRMQNGSSPRISPRHGRITIAQNTWAEEHPRKTVGSFEGASVAPSSYKLSVTSPSHESLGIHLGDDMLVHLLKAEDEGTGSPKALEEAPIVDAELLDCIESALDHFGEVKLDS